LPPSIRGVVFPPLVSKAAQTMISSCRPSRFLNPLACGRHRPPGHNETREPGADTVGSQHSTSASVSPVRLGRLAMCCRRGVPWDAAPFAPSAPPLVPRQRRGVRLPPLRTPPAGPPDAATRRGGEQGMTHRSRLGENHQWGDGMPPPTSHPPPPHRVRAGAPRLGHGVGCVWEVCGGRPLPRRRRRVPGPRC